MPRLFEHIIVRSVRDHDGTLYSPGSAPGNQDSGAAAPVAGAWTLGWIRWNSNPVAGENIGWVCTVAGTPGTWKAFGTISV
jgi:hypothetical protein